MAYLIQEEKVKRFEQVSKEFLKNLGFNLCFCLPTNVCNNTTEGRY